LTFLSLAFLIDAVVLVLIPPAAVALFVGVLPLVPGVSAV
jgi:hypothetical protein